MCTHNPLIIKGEVFFPKSKLSLSQKKKAVENIKN
jgi:hypothetical protein